MSGQESPLAGGRLNQVVRIDGAVHRPTGPWTPTVHALLDHLSDKGFPFSPRVLGFDDDGREKLSYLPGDTVGIDMPWPDWVWAEHLLTDIGAATALYHRAAADFRPSGVIPWRWKAAELGPDQIVCHHDLAPYNAVFREGRLTGIIDWDLIGPGTVRSELAFVAWQWIPMHDPVVAGFFSRVAPDIARRLRLLLDGYGLDDRHGFIAEVVERVRLNREVMVAKAAAGDKAYRQLVSDGHVMGMERAIDYLCEREDELQAQI